MNNFFEFDADPEETQEWIDSFYLLLLDKGEERASFILRKLFKVGLINNCNVKAVNTDYRNTVANDMDVSYPGNLALEQRILSVIRWNAMAMVVRANIKDSGLGGHLSTYASCAVLYEVGFNHFWRKDDLVFMQGHASPGIYARAFLEGRLSTEQLTNFRQEAFANGLASYPHPWSMPDFWQFSTVSMGLGPIQAIYQARFNKYLQARDLAQTADKKVWCFCGDGEMDEPESLGAITVAAREKLDNLIFVINCNLQRLDGPVRGNSKIVQELESVFIGAGWNVIKVIWNSKWEELLDQDQTGALMELMQNTVDGEYQNFYAKGGAHLREHFFCRDPAVKKLVAKWSDEELSQLEFGGHDFNKVYQAYRLAVNHKHQPTVILTKTTKGYGFGAAGESLNTAHSLKKLNIDHLQAFKQRFNIPVNEQQLENIEFCRLEANSQEQQYLLNQRNNLGGFLPWRRSLGTDTLPVTDKLLADHINNDKVRTISTTMAMVRILNSLCKDRELGKHIVPIVADEARTFGMEGFFRQFSIYAPFGQMYEPVDAQQVMFYKEQEDGQILQEGITEAGAFCSWLAAATAYSNHDKIMAPFYIYYSMFGFQRIADLIWAAADMRARGFLIGATAGRTTLAGEGLQHCDGHSHVMAGTVPNCLSYDPTFAYELAVIIEDGLHKMFKLQQDVFYYITVMNENYPQLTIPTNVDLATIKANIVKGMYLLQEDGQYPIQVQLIGSGAILNEVLAAKEILNKEFNISANVWSATSINLLAREAREIREHSLFAGQDAANADPKVSHIHSCLGDVAGPVIAATDYIKQYAEQLREFIPNRYIVLGTDGFGYSDTRENLRKLFKVSASHIVKAAIQGLIEDGKLKPDILTGKHKILIGVE
jgi:pyruvate dehydrogenase E1 component